eukprot:gene4298-4550_t
MKVLCLYMLALVLACCISSSTAARTAFLGGNSAQGAPASPSPKPTALLPAIEAAHPGLFPRLINRTSLAVFNWPVFAACSAFFMLWWLVHVQKRHNNRYSRVSKDIETGHFSVNDGKSSSSSSLFARDTFQKFWFREHRMLRNALYHKGLLEQFDHVIHSTEDKLDVLEANWAKCGQRDVLSISDTTKAPKVFSMVDSQCVAAARSQALSNMFAADPLDQHAKQLRMQPAGFQCKRPSYFDSLDTASGWKLIRKLESQLDEAIAGAQTLLVLDVLEKREAAKQTKARNYFQRKLHALKKEKQEA